jgi:hypothetical protein
LWRPDGASPPTSLRRRRDGGAGHAVGLAADSGEDVADDPGDVAAGEDESEAEGGETSSTVDSAKAVTAWPSFSP